ncbi:MAG: lytic transglycosylase domain-containing protein [Janthinobacterium lividum]
MKLVVTALLLAGISLTTAARADCFMEAAQYHHVNPLILKAIAWRESRGDADALHINQNGSTDYGMMQINSVHLPVLSQWGISTDTLMQPCASVYIAAWHLHNQMEKYGNTWEAVGAYHSETPTLRDNYARQIIKVLMSWGEITSVNWTASTAQPRRLKNASRAYRIRLSSGKIHR